MLTHNNKDIEREHDQSRRPVSKEEETWEERIDRGGLQEKIIQIFHPQTKDIFRLRWSVECPAQQIRKDPQCYEISEC